MSLDIRSYGNHIIPLISQYNLTTHVFLLCKDETISHFLFLFIYFFLLSLKMFLSKDCETRGIKAGKVSITTRRLKGLCALRPQHSFVKLFFFSSYNG